MTNPQVATVLVIAAACSNPAGIWLVELTLKWEFS